MSPRRKKLRGRLVVSAENNGYTGWQAQVLARSAITRLGVSPVVVCHGGNERPLHGYFQQLRYTGTDVLAARNWRREFGHDYAPANTPGTLLAAAQALKGHADFLILLDPDMVFAKPVEFLPRFAAQHYRYMDYRKDAIQRAARLYGVAQELLEERHEQLSVGVPYVIPIEFAEDLAKEWLRALACFAASWTKRKKHGSDRWCEVMHAFGLAATKLGRIPEVLDVNANNAFPKTPLERPVIHYCYEGDGWKKRSFFREDAVPDVWKTPDRPELAGTVTGEVLAQIRETAEFFGHGA